MTPKAEYQLKLASGLLGLGDMAPKDVADYIRYLTPAERETLRGQVDWVAAYDGASKDNLPRSSTSR